MKKLIYFLLFCGSLNAVAQQNIHATNELAVVGEVLVPLTFTTADIEKLSSRAIPDVVITNHLGIERSGEVPPKGPSSTPCNPDTYHK